VPARLREPVARRSNYRCGYCATPVKITGARMVIDHIVPEAAGGPTKESNLWLACHACNEFKGPQSHARDPLTGRRVRLFNPRRQRWSDHFTWSEDGSKVISTTACGRATALALQMNHTDIVFARRRWAYAGWWPPEDE